MGNDSGNHRIFNSHRNKCVLNFQTIDCDVKKLVDKLRCQRKKRGLEYTLLKASENDILILIYPNGKRRPRLSDYKNFERFKGYRTITELRDLIIIHKKKKGSLKKANIKVAKTEDSKKFYWIKYI